MILQVKGFVEYMGELGVENLPRLKNDHPELAERQPSQADRDSTPLPEAETLEDIRRSLGDCRRCPLCQTRTNIVFGEGPPDAAVMFIGEGPGRDEDQQGRPFVGRAGSLLTDIIVKGMKMPREDCYIANIVKCRPPQNRDPEPMEARACVPFLKRQIQSIKPRVIVALGKIASNHLLNNNLPLIRLRHKFHDLDGIPVMPTFHPAALLRAPERKRDAWEDIKLVIKLLQQTDK